MPLEHISHNNLMAYQLAQSAHTAHVYTDGINALRVHKQLSLPSFLKPLKFS